ncbi:MAG TPA: L,D-transpeptidase [Candidatus Saccharimonadales bacterium]|nr:L,D-transpeptidase [Candidatus Saccharimonadales bacterium]
MKRLALIILPIIALVILYKPVLQYLNRQANINPNLLQETFDSNAKTAEFHGEKVQVPTEIPTPTQLAENVLGSHSNRKEKRIEVNLTTQTLTTYEGSKKIHSYLVSTGKWAPTPTGEFRIWTKLRYVHMVGGSKAINTFYDLPNVPYTMFFYNADVPKYKGYGIHGTYWHHNFGHPMSHGCINMRTDQAAEVFNWASSEQENGTGTKLIIFGAAPNN